MVFMYGKAWGSMKMKCTEIKLTLFFNPCFILFSDCSDLITFTNKQTKNYFTLYYFTFNIIFDFLSIWLLIMMINSAISKSYFKW